MHTIVIAEAGVNHNGSLELAQKMVDAAVECKADYIKFQTAIPESLVSRFAQKAAYQAQNTSDRESQLEMLRRLLLPFEDFLRLKEYCCRKHISFLSTPFDLESIAFLDKLDMDFWKIPSGEITNFPYLRKIGLTGKKVVMSTGMSEMEEIGAAIEVLREYGCPNITLLHCNTEYPTPYHDVNLRAMHELKETFGVEVGYSDHTQGIEVPIAAVAIGATIIEKHFTLDRNMQGPDHKASLEPCELQSMVTQIRHIEKALGSGVKSVTESERKNIMVARKSIVAARNISKGEVLTEENITTKRPGNGISPMEWENILGTKAAKNYQEDEVLSQ